jgi:hypothetical protein
MARTRAERRKNLAQKGVCLLLSIAAGLTSMSALSSMGRLLRVYGLLCLKKLGAGSPKRRQPRRKEFASLSDLAVLRPVSFGKGSVYKRIKRRKTQ